MMNEGSVECFLHLFIYLFEILHGALEIHIKFSFQSGVKYFKRVLCIAVLYLGIQEQLKKSYKFAKVINNNSCISSEKVIFL